MQRRTNETREIRLETDVRCALRCRGNTFLGLGEIEIAGRRIRAGKRPMFVDIRNPWGVQLRDYRLLDCAPHGNGLRLSFAMRRETGGPMDWQLHTCRPVRALSDWSAGPRAARGTELTLDLEPVARRIGSREFAGFRYQYRYRSPDLPIYLILDRATWELDGSARAGEFWLRQSCAPTVYRPKTLAERYATEWYLQPCVNSNIFQFLPLQTQLQGFTMTAGDAGVLLTWSPKVAHIRSYFEKPRGTDLFAHLHEHGGDLAREFETAPMEVLFAPGATSRVERANLHGDMMELVYETLHADVGFRREYVPTYGQIEEWGAADLDLYRREGIPALAEAGIRHVELANHFQNNMNVWGLSNMCCTVDYKVAESVGEDRLRAFCADASARGLRVGMWGNTAISTMTVLLSRKNGESDRIRRLPEEGAVMQALAGTPRPFVLNSYGAIEADHYTPVFCALNLRDPVVRDYWLKSWRHLREGIGVTGLFLDSSFNMSSDKFNWRYNADPDTRGGATIDQADLLGHMRPAQEPASSIESAYLAHLELMREMQAMGYLYCGEDCGVFGIHRSGPALAARLDNLWMWREFVAEFDAAACRQAGADPDEVFFRGLAYRMMWSLRWIPSARCLSFHPYGANAPEDAPRDWHFALYRAYNAVEAHMRRRTILPEEAGVVYNDGNRRVVWSFAAGRLPLGGRHYVRNVLTGETFETDELALQPRQIYADWVEVPVS
jgi:hypothetical protein